MTSTDVPVRLATIGTSVITAALVEAVRAVDGIRIEAVHSRDAARGEQKAREFDARWTTSSLDELLASADVDAVYIASPNSAHADQVRRALEAGKHVLVEKPAVTSAEEWRELVTQATDAGVVLLEAMRTAYDPGLARVRSILPELGTLRYASLRYQKRSSRYTQVLAGERVNMFDPALAGGALMDLGVYCIHAMVALFGMPRSLQAASVPVRSGVDGAGSVLADYDGLVVDLAFSKITTSAGGSEIQGEDATLAIDDVSAPRMLELRRLDGASEVIDVAGPTTFLSAEVERFVHLVRSGDDQSAEHAMTEQTLRVLEAVRAQA